MRSLIVGLLGLAIYLGGAARLSADEAQPVAVRFWPDRGVTIETMWDLHIGLGLSKQAQQTLPRPVDVHVALKTDDPTHILDRKPNQPHVQWQPAEDVAEPSPNAVRVSVVPLQKTDDAESAVITMVTVDGIRIADATHFSAAELAQLLKKKSDAADALELVDVLLLGDSGASEPDLVSINWVLVPSLVVLPAEFERKTVGEQEIIEVDHNTLAVASTAEVAETRWIKLGNVPWKMNEPLASLFTAKEAASKDSRATFAALSTAQMSFEPSNGTHTPRWNAEHMMGRELLFFSQIYHAVDKKIPVMDLNPQQMPKDYRAAHPQWTGAEEARQMQRVESFTRRFAYLLEGLDLDKRAPGSRNWTPRSLLEQMQRHYGEHTENVRKKMQLAEWPEK